MTLSLSPKEKIINVEKETRNIKGIGKDTVVKPENLHLGYIFVDVKLPKL